MKELRNIVRSQITKWCIVATLWVVGLTLGIQEMNASAVDTTFLRNSHTLIFSVNSSHINKRDSLWIADTLMVELNKYGPDAVITGRAAASPEGPYWNNVRLAKARMQATIRVLRRLGYKYRKIQFEEYPEDWEILIPMMQLANDPDTTVITNLLKRYPTQLAQRKQYMRTQQPKLWNRLLSKYFPEIRGVRIIATEPSRLADHALIWLDEPIREIPHYSVKLDKVPQGVTYINIVPAVKEKDSERIKILSASDTQPSLELLPRLKALSIRTNLLYNAFYMPNYGMAPIPNFMLEYFPREGCWSYGAGILLADWEKWSTQEFFQVQDLHLEVKRYFRKAPKRNQMYYAADRYEGFYLAGYADINRWGIGLDADRGWKGEGVGAGLAIGANLPLTRNHRWMLDITAGFGGYVCMYDPYVWYNPLTGKVDGLYYYKWFGKAEDFRRRQHRFTWLGPTQVGISLTYNLFYHRYSRGMSTRRWERKGGQLW